MYRIEKSLCRPSKWPFSWWIKNEPLISVAQSRAPFFMYRLMLVGNGLTVVTALLP